VLCSDLRNSPEHALEKVNISGCRKNICDVLRRQQNVFLNLFLYILLKTFYVDIDSFVLFDQKKLKNLDEIRFMTKFWIYFGRRRYSGKYHLYLWHFQIFATLKLFILLNLFLTIFINFSCWYRFICSIWPKKKLKKSGWHLIYAGSSKILWTSQILQKISLIFVTLPNICDAQTKFFFSLIIHISCTIQMHSELDYNT